MKNKVLWIVAIFFMALPTSGWAVDVVGNWIAYEPPVMSGTVATIFSLKMDGTKLTGTVSYPEGEIGITEGSINGDEISLSIIRNFAGNPTKVTFKGKVELNQITFRREVKGWVGPEFVAKREFQRNNGLVPSRTAPLVPPLPKP